MFQGYLAFSFPPRKPLRASGMCVCAHMHTCAQPLKVKNWCQGSQSLQQQCSANVALKFPSFCPETPKGFHRAEGSCGECGKLKVKLLSSVNKCFPASDLGYTGAKLCNTGSCPLLLNQDFISFARVTFWTLTVILFANTRVSINGVSNTNRLPAVLYDLSSDFSPQTAPPPTRLTFFSY